MKMRKNILHVEALRETYEAVNPSLAILLSDWNTMVIMLLVEVIVGGYELPQYLKWAN